MARRNIYPEPVKISRSRTLPNAGSKTLFFTAEGGGSGNSRCRFIKPEHVPEFEGETAWAILEKIPGKPWPYWRVVELVEPPVR